jgi:hypothetical protein
MKNNTDFKKVFKVFIIGFILISSIYVLYFYNNNNNILEDFANCSKCKLAPSNSSKCKPLYNINYNWNSNTKMVDISNQLTDYVFCEWESDCNYANTANNSLTQEQRIGLSNTQLQTYYNNTLR